jgi:hypothetical protein
MNMEMLIVVFALFGMSMLLVCLILGFAVGIGALLVDDAQVTAEKTSDRMTPWWCYTKAREEASREQHE